MSSEHLANGGETIHLNNREKCFLLYSKAAGSRNGTRLKEGYKFALVKALSSNLQCSPKFFRRFSHNIWAWVRSSHHCSHPSGFSFSSPLGPIFWTCLIYVLLPVPGQVWLSYHFQVEHAFALFVVTSISQCWLSRPSFSAPFSYRVRVS